MLHTMLVLALTVPGLAPAADTIRRCQAPDGTMVYTDRPCAAHDARPVSPPEKVAEPGTAEGTSDSTPRAPGSVMDRGGAVSLGGVSRDDCVRRTDTLLFEIRAAIDARNVNRLASVYDWAGKDASAAGSILERLGRITERPSASVEFRYPEPAFYADATTMPASASPSDDRPIGVRIEQMAPGELTPSFEQDLRLVRNADCWWVSF